MGDNMNNEEMGYPGQRFSAGSGVVVVWIRLRQIRQPCSMYRMNLE